MSSSESSWKGLLSVFGSIVAMFIMVGFLAWSCDDKNERIRNQYKEQEENSYKKYYIDFMADCKAANKLKTCCEYDFKRTYVKSFYEPEPNFCKTPEALRPSSEDGGNSSGRSMGDHVKQGVGVGIGLKVINSLL